VDHLAGGEPYFFRGGSVGALLVHGFTGAPREMRPVAEALAAAGHTALGVRLAHHGTRIEDMLRSHWQDWYASVLDGYRVLADQCGTVFVMGLSMGADLSLCLAAERPVAGVVALSTPGRPRLDEMGWRMRYARLLSLIKPFADKGPPDPNGDPDHAAYPRYPVRAIGELRPLLLEVERRLPQVRAPALVIHSRRDTSVPPANGQHIFDHLGSQDKDLLWLEQSGHIVTEGPERALVQDAVVRFVAAHSPASAAA